MLPGKLYLDRASAMGESVREAERRLLRADATLRDSQSQPIDVEVINLSSSGCLIGLAGGLEVPSIVTIGISGIGRVPARVIRRDGIYFGCAFLVPISSGAVLLASAMDSVVTLPRAVHASPAPVAQRRAVRPLAARLALPIGMIVSWALVVAAFGVAAIFL